MSETILLVEDEPSIADNITYALETEGFQARWHRTGQEALATLGAQAVALVILDVGLPDGNGFDLAREIRRRHDVPIIFVTARSHEIDRIIGLEIGADDYMVKPFSPRELTARVRAVLRRTRAAPVPAAQKTPEEPARAPALPFHLDEERHRITYCGTILELSRYEFRLLAILVRRPGQVFSRDQLMQLAWDEPGISLDRTVDTHMKTIRQKLKLVRSEEDPIVTHRGVGYSLKERE